MFCSLNELEKGAIWYLYRQAKWDSTGFYVTYKNIIAVIIAAS
jgi:hypothetical protein